LVFKRAPLVVSFVIEAVASLSTISTKTADEQALRETE